MRRCDLCRNVRYGRCPPWDGHHGSAIGRSAIGGDVSDPIASLGVLAARTGGAPVLKGAVRVVFWGALAMLVTALVGKAVGASV